MLFVPSPNTHTHTHTHLCPCMHMHTKQSTHAHTPRPSLYFDPLRTPRKPVSQRNTHFFSCFSVSENRTRGKDQEKMLCFTSKVTPPFVYEVSSPFLSSWSSLAACCPPETKSRGCWLQRAPDVAPRDPSRCGLPEGPGSGLHPCVGRRKGGAC